MAPLPAPKEPPLGSAEGRGVMRGESHLRWGMPDSEELPDLPSGIVPGAADRWRKFSPRGGSVPPFPPAHLQND
jgi:hypothetical protein